ncbi:MAG: hypothetical protein AMJ55_09680 [Gammaproteobacteria bacterium SG8_15]|nr:MAG: hypothetical protein AMJ55_09680 [Gammaproteobacteria bacterium SG8_15]
MIDRKHYGRGLARILIVFSNRTYRLIAIEGDTDEQYLLFQHQMMWTNCKDIRSIDRTIRKK